MSRPVFSFRPNLENPKHKKAWEILHRVPEGQKNQFLVEVILKEQETDYLEGLIRKVVREEVNGGIGAQSSKAMEQEIPNEMLDFLSRMGEEGV